MLRRINSGNKESLFFSIMEFYGIKIIEKKCINKSKERVENFAFQRWNVIFGGDPVRYDRFD